MNFWKGEEMKFDYNKLHGRIIEKYKTQSKFAVAMGWSERTLSLKLNNERDWKQSDIIKAVKLLCIIDKDIPIYFFNTKVQNIELIR